MRDIVDTMVLSDHLRACSEYRAREGRELEIFNPLIERTIELLIKFDYQQRAMLGAK